MKRTLSIILADFTTGSEGYAGAPLFTDSNFRDFPTGWVVAGASGCTATVAQGTDPAGKADAGSLQPLGNGGKSFQNALVSTINVVHGE